MSEWEPFRRLADAVGVVALDVGARGGITTDLRPIGRAVDHFCFEPDLQEYDRLTNSATPSDARSVRYIPWALAGEECTFDLNLYRQRGCSSRYEAIVELGERFSRGDYYLLDGRVPVRARTLDDVVAEYGVDAPAFMKIDVQGMEVECFAGAKRALSESLVGIRTEVSFLEIYRDQPLFAEVDRSLRPYGFTPMRFLELHEWRRSTRVKPPRLADGPLPYSRGQMVHGDVLYLVSPEGLLADTEAAVRRLIRLGLVASCFEHFDHARAALARPAVREYCQREVSTDPLVTLETLSKSAAAGRGGVRGAVRRYLARLT